MRVDRAVLPVFRDFSSRYVMLVSRIDSQCGEASCVFFESVKAPMLCECLNVSQKDRGISLATKTRACACCSGGCQAILKGSKGMMSPPVERIASYRAPEALSA